MKANDIDKVSVEKLPKIEFFDWKIGRDKLIKIEMDANCDSICQEESKKTEEGYSFTRIIYELHGHNQIKRTTVQGGRDCDGYMEDIREEYCNMIDGKVVVTNGFFNLDGCMAQRPDWKYLSHRVFDKEAQKAGY